MRKITVAAIIGMFVVSLVALWLGDERNRLALGDQQVLPGQSELLGVVIGMDIGEASRELVRRGLNPLSEDDARMIFPVCGGVEIDRSHQLLGFRDEGIVRKGNVCLVGHQGRVIAMRAGYTMVTWP